MNRARRSGRADRTGILPDERHLLRDRDRDRDRAGYRAGAVARGAMALALVALAAGCGGRSAPQPIDPAWAAEVEAWRVDRETRLREEESWLTLVGLHWLEPGESRFGSDPANPIVFPEGSAPATAGAFHYDGTSVEVEALEGAVMTVADESVTRLVLADDGEGATPDVVRLGRLRFYVIARDGRHAIRVKDPESPVRTRFTGLDWYPLDPAWRIEGRFRPYGEPREIQVPNVTGGTTRQFVPGDVEFEVGSARYKLVPLVNEPGETHFFFIVQDQTSGNETYAAGRYFYGDLDGDSVVLDFNMAYNPPCVFTPYATCTLPPPGNRLDVAIRAGEKNWGAHH